MNKREIWLTNEMSMSVCMVQFIKISPSAHLEFALGICSGDGIKGSCFFHGAWLVTRLFSPVLFHYPKIEMKILFPLVFFLFFSFLRSNMKSFLRSFWLGKLLTFRLFVCVEYLFWGGWGVLFLPLWPENKLHVLLETSQLFGVSSLGTLSFSVNPFIQISITT